MVYSSHPDKMISFRGKGECRLQMEAQRISLSQIHAAQLELLQEHTDAHAHSLELKLQHLKEHHGQGEPLCAVVFEAFDPSFIVVSGVPAMLR